MSSVSFVTHLNKVNVISNNYFNLKIKTNLLFLVFFFFFPQVIFLNCVMGTDHEGMGRMYTID